MKLSPAQQSDLDSLMPEVVSYVKRHSYRSYHTLADDLRQISKKKTSLKTFTWTKEKIAKVKKLAGIQLKGAGIAKQAQEQKLVKKIKERIGYGVTTAWVKSEWARVYYGTKKPSKSSLSRFRTRNGFETTKNKKTGNKDVWILKK